MALSGSISDIQFAKNDQERLALDFFLPSSATEIIDTSTTAATADTALVVGQMYILLATDSVAFITLNGQTPVASDGTGITKGVPIAVGVPIPFIPRTGQTALKVVTAFGTGKLILCEASEARL